MCSLKELQEMMLNMLVDIDLMCRKHGICYYLTAGTLLGAVRHQGFIPWDDDADIMMPRKDYDRFLAIAEKELDSRYFVQYHKTEPYYRHTFAKIRRNGTACIIQNHRHIPMHQGIFIDIFPLENAPSSKLMLNCIWWIGSVADKLCAFSVSKLPSNYNWLLPVKWIFECAFKPSLFASMGNWIIRVIQPRRSDRLICIMGSTKLNEIPYLWLGRGRDILFAGRILRAPENGEAYLEKLYGDFMQLPPIEQRQPAHAKDGTQVSSETDYRAFIPELYGNGSCSRRQQA